MKFSIIIPTYNHCDDLLKPCIDSIIQHTDLSQVEVFIVANGCTDETETYLKTLSPPFFHLVYKEPLGYAKACNIGMRYASGDNIILLNNDTVLLPQNKNEWLDRLVVDDETITGILKHQNSNLLEPFIIFFCANVPRKVFLATGYLDESFGVGGGEDIDYCVRAQRLGFKTKNIVESVFNGELAVNSYPIYHKGEGTVKDQNLVFNWEGIFEENMEKVVKKHSRVGIILPMYNSSSTILRTLDAIREQTHANWFLYVVNDASTDDSFDKITRATFGMDNVKILNTGVNRGPSSSRNMALRNVGDEDYIAFCDADDVWDPYHLEKQIKFLISSNADVVSSHTRCVDSNGQQMLMYGVPEYNEPTYENLLTGNRIHISSVVMKNKVYKKVWIFDPTLDGIEDWDYWVRVWEDGFVLKQNPETTVTYLVVPGGMAGSLNDTKLNLFHNKRVKKNKYSIIIPTYNQEELLVKCLESLNKYTNRYNVEVIVVANGCSRKTLDYLDRWHGLGDIALIFDKPLGYARAINEGIKKAAGDFIILLNDDVEFTEQPKDLWIEMLLKPFSDPKVGITGPLPATFFGRPILFFTCVMMKKALFNEIGMLDGDFKRGAGEDSEFCLRAQKAGYTLKGVADITVNDELKIYESDFPIYHKGGATMQSFDNWEQSLVEHMELAKYKCFEEEKLIKLNLGCGDEVIEGYISCDLYGDKAEMRLDAKDLSVFADNSVDEIRAYHLIEHFTFQIAFKVLKEWRRVLKPGGKIVLETPDFLATCKKFVEVDEPTRLYLYGHFFAWPDLSPGQVHYFLYTQTQMEWTLRECGFTEFQRVKPDSIYARSNPQWEDLYMKMEITK